MAPGDRFGERDRHLLGRCPRYPDGQRGLYAAAKLLMAEFETGRLERVVSPVRSVIISHRIRRSHRIVPGLPLADVTTVAQRGR